MLPKKVPFALIKMFARKLKDNYEKSDSFRAIDICFDSVLLKFDIRGRDNLVRIRFYESMGIKSIGFEFFGVVGYPIGFQFQVSDTEVEKEIDEKRLFRSSVDFIDFVLFSQSTELDG